MKKAFFGFLASAFLMACQPAGPTLYHAATPAGDLTKSEATAFSTDLSKEWKDSVKYALQDMYAKQSLTLDGKTMRIWWKTYGSKLSDGRSLYISLHGGGGTTASENDGQWNNQKQLYSPGEGIYLCPRAISNTWDLHFLKETDAFYKKIIQMAVTFLDVNPNKVYLMGYSAGGDGVWRLAPRLADHWAAASMMAGHPGDVSLVNLRNTPFMIWCGAEDSAYDRNIECQKRIDEMAALHEADPEGYIFEGHIVEGKGHWMDLKDAAALPWMAQFKRNPFPKKVVWKQEEVRQPYFYWLGCPTSEMLRGKEVVASVSGNTITLEKCDYSSLTLFLSDDLVNLDQPVKVVYGDKPLFEGTLVRKGAVQRKTLQMRNDLAYACPALLEIKIK